MTSKKLSACRQQVQQKCQYQIYIRLSSIYSPHTQKNPQKQDTLKANNIASVKKEKTNLSSQELCVWEKPLSGMTNGKYQWKGWEATGTIGSQE